MISAETIATPRLATHVLDTGGAGQPVVFLHGNLSDGEVWREQMERLPEGFRGLAPDLRGYGRSERKGLDATRGVGDFVDDVRALFETLDLGSVHLVAHSLGSGVALGYAIRHPAAVRSLTLAAPMSPYGFGGTRPDGTPWFPDGAGGGAGAVNPDFVRRVAEGDRGDEAPTSPRNVIRTMFFPDPGLVRDEDAILDSMLRAAVGDDAYPGDAATSEHWPGIAPGTRGVLNAISRRYLDLGPFASCGATAPVLWARGAKDAIIADGSLYDMGHLGALGVVPDWPGTDTCPPQPMVAQMRALLDAYAAAGGSYREESFDEAGHFLFTQEPDRFARVLHAHLLATAA